jgi:hypothetical protein
LSIDGRCGYPHREEVAAGLSRHNPFRVELTREEPREPEAMLANVLQHIVTRARLVLLANPKLRPAREEGHTMTSRILTFVCAVLLLAMAAGAQPADSVSGSWVSDGATFLELKFDGKRTVTGTAIWRGRGQALRTPIKNGTYDARTRTLRLEGEGTRPDGAGGTFVIEGTINGNVVSGTFKFADSGGDFKFTRVPPGQRTPEQIEASFNEHKGDFDYLLGDWEFTADSKEFGKHGGYWSAVKLAEGQVLDEYRVTGDKGETYYVTTSLRNYNKFADRWELIGADAGTGMQDFGTARRVGSEMHIEQKFSVAGGEPAIMRIRYYNIEKDRFSWAADRSTDGGKTWVKNHLQIEARRIGPARSLGPLAPARNKTSRED